MCAQLPPYFHAIVRDYFSYFYCLIGIRPRRRVGKKTMLFKRETLYTHGIPRESRGLLSRRRDVHNLWCVFMNISQAS